jgi:hypothetical protein
MMIVNTSGWDTDCNSGNLGCLLGIRDGLAAFEGDVDWRGPVADRMYVPTADAGAGVTDAVTETMKIVNIGRALAGLKPVAPKGGARFHFTLPGSVQGFEGEGAEVANVEDMLAIRAQGEGGCAWTRTWARAKDFGSGGYRMAASPTLYAGQTLRARLIAAEENASDCKCKLYVEAVGAEDAPARYAGDDVMLAPGAEAKTEWRVPDTQGAPIARVGVEIVGARVVHLDSLTWVGEPDARLIPTDEVGVAWHEAWVDGASMLRFGHKGNRISIRQNHDTGLVIQGTREWADYHIEATVKTDLSSSAGVAARVGGMRRYYALCLVKDGVCLAKRYDDETRVLAEVDLEWRFGEMHELVLEVAGDRLRGSVDGKELIDVRDNDARLRTGAAALIVEEGHLACDAFTVTPAEGGKR